MSYYRNVTRAYGEEGRKGRAPCPASSEATRCNRGGRLASFSVFWCKLNYYLELQGGSLLRESSW